MKLGAVGNDLSLIESLDGDTVSIDLVDGNIGIAELTMTEQLADGVLVVEIFGVTKIGTLAAGDGAGSALGRSFGIGSRRSLGFRVVAGFAVVVMMSVVGLTTSSTAASTSDFNGGETDTHGSDDSTKKGDMRVWKQSTD